MAMMVEVDATQHDNRESKNRNRQMELPAPSENRDALQESESKFLNVLVIMLKMMKKYGYVTKTWGNPLKEFPFGIVALLACCVPITHPAVFVTDQLSNALSALRPQILPNWTFPSGLNHTGVILLPTSNIAIIG